MIERVTVALPEIHNKITTILTGVGVTAIDSKLVADSLIDAESSGVESHGLTRLKVYVDRIVEGTIVANPDIQITVNGIIAKVDGKNGLGQIISCKAVDKCIELAKKNGVGIASVGHSNHFGTAAYYAKRMATFGCLGISATNAGSTTAPFGGMDKLLGTNPFSVAFPATKQIFCADMATSVVAKGKIRIYAKKNKQIPVGWALDVDGNDTTDPEAAIKGILLPMSGHKGYALAMIIDALCGLLSGANLSCETVPMVNSSQPSNIGQFFCAIDIEHFLPLLNFEARAQMWFERIKNSKSRPDMTIMIPGEPEIRHQEKMQDNLNVLKETMDIVDKYYAKYCTK